MNILLEQFLIEGRECLEAMSARLLEIERAPNDPELLDDLFRRMHTLKGNSGLFPDLRDFIAVVHAGEDVLDALRDGALTFSGGLADVLFEALDLIARMLDQIGETETLGDDFSAEADRLVVALRELLARAEEARRATTPTEVPVALAPAAPVAPVPEWFTGLPASLHQRITDLRQTGEAAAGISVAHYAPESACFFKGEDPLLLVRQSPGLAALDTRQLEPWPEPTAFDPYRSNLSFTLVSVAEDEALREHFRYVDDQVQFYHLPALTDLTAGTGMVAAGVTGAAPDPALTGAAQVAASTAPASTAPAATDAAAPASVAADRRADLVSAPLPVEPSTRVEGLSEEEHTVFEQILQIQAALLVGGDPATRHGRWRAVASVCDALANRIGGRDEAAAITAALEQALLTGEASELGDILQSIHAMLAEVVARGTIDVPEAPGALVPGALAPAAAAEAGTVRMPPATMATPAAIAAAIAAAAAAREKAAATATAAADTSAAGPAHSNAALAGTAPAAAISLPGTAAAATGTRDGARDAVRTEDDHGGGESGPRVLRVRQEKIDRLMDLVGEMVVAKNALPYLATRAEALPGARELAREIKANYQVINRISEELQDSIMQVRMLPVSSVFQRFPRLVRDVSRKLGKLVQLEITGEETEADKNIIESLADPLIHILRNSLDHGIEAPEVRTAAGKPAQGLIRIHAYQESDRVMIEIHDDGHGIDPEVIRTKAYAKGLVDEARLSQMSDQEAIQLVFAAGFSTAEQISELSGRGVGMDVVRRGIERVHGTIALDSTVGRGTSIRIALPLSMAVTSVMLVRSAAQPFGVPMDLVVETVRVSRFSIHTIKTQRTAVLRGRIVPLFALNELLGVPIEQTMNGDEELAVLVVRVGAEHVGIVVDDFEETLEIILKPLDGVLSGLIGYAGTALMGDGSVLMVLNVKELL